MAGLERHENFEHPVPFHADSWGIVGSQYANENGVTSCAVLYLRNVTTGESVGVLLQPKTAGYLGMDLLGHYVDKEL